MVVCLNFETFFLMSTYFKNLNLFIIKIIALNDFKYFDKLAMSVFDSGEISSLLHSIYCF